MLTPRARCEFQGKLEFPSAYTPSNVAFLVRIPADRWIAKRTVRSSPELVFGRSALDRSQIDLRQNGLKPPPPRGQALGARATTVMPRREACARVRLRPRDNVHLDVLPG
jgi:hypothetical protein